MSSDQIFKLIYAGVAIFGTYLTAARLIAGNWTSALWPLLIVLFCVFRLLTLDDSS